MPEALDCLPRVTDEDMLKIFNHTETSPTGMRGVNTKILRDSVPLAGRSFLLPRGPLVAKGQWTGADIKFDAVKAIADAGAESKMIAKLKNDFDFEVIVSSGDRARSSGAPQPKVRTENGDFFGTIQGALPPNPFIAKLIQSVRDNAQLQYYQDFFESKEASDYVGMFLAPGRNTPGLSDAATRPLGNRPVMLLKDFADRETILHEFIHYQIYLDRQQKGESDPWLPDAPDKNNDFFYDLNKNPVPTIEKQISKLKKQIARVGEELDVHRFIADFGHQFGLTRAQINSSAQGFKDHLTGSNYSSGMKNLIDEIDVLKQSVAFLKNLPEDSKPKIKELTDSIDVLLKDNREKFTEAMHWRPK